MAVITYDSRTKRTFDFSTKNIYFAFGRTTPWPDENVPLAPAITTSEVEEILFISKVTEVKFVVPGPEGGSDIDFKNSHWQIIVPVDDQTIYDENVTNLYLKTVLDYDTFELASFRQVGLLEDPLKLDGTVCTESQYDDSELLSQGVLHYLDNRLVTNRQVNQLETISIVLEF